ncbi:MAG: hypothetical protein AAGB12_03010 [Pseudomonadota bacterium]
MKFLKVNFLNCFHIALLITIGGCGGGDSSGDNALNNSNDGSNGGASQPINDDGNDPSDGSQDNDEDEGIENNDEGGDDEGNEGATEENSNKRVLEESINTSSNDLMDCKKIAEDLQNQDILYEYTGDKNTLLEHVEFVNTFNDQQTDGFVKLNAQNYQLTVIESKALYQHVINDDGTTTTPELVCTLPTKLGYIDFNFSITHNDALTQWVSDEAADNQEVYDDEDTVEIIREISGKDGLAFGRFAYGGIFLQHQNHRPNFISDFNFFTMLWEIQHNDSEVLFEWVPTTIELQEDRQWLSECDLNTLRFSSNEAFIDASGFLRLAEGNCQENVPFSQEQAQEFADTLPSNREDFLSENTTSFHRVARLLDANGELTDCEPRDTISVDGCSQPIYQQIFPMLRRLLLGEENVYIEWNVSDKVQKVFKINKQTGVLTELTTRLQ